MCACTCRTHTYIHQCTGIVVLFVERTGKNKKSVQRQRRADKEWEWEGERKKVRNPNKKKKKGGRNHRSRTGGFCCIDWSKQEEDVRWWARTRWEWMTEKATHTLRKHEPTNTHIHTLINTHTYTGKHRKFQFGCQTNQINAEAQNPQTRPKTWPKTQRSLLTPACSQWHSFNISV